MTDPEIFLVAKFSGTRVILSTNSGNVYGDPYKERISITIHPENYDNGDDHNSVVNMGTLHLDNSETLTRAGLIYITCVNALNELGFSWQLGVYFNVSQAYLTDHCLGAIYSVGWEEAFDHELMIMELVACVLDRIDALSGTPASPAGFTAVTNEGYAWDEGLKAFLGAVLADNPVAPLKASPPGSGLNLESGVPAPPSTPDAPKIAATVAACLYDFEDSHGDGRDSFDGTLAQVMSVLYQRPVHSLSEFWSFWKSDGHTRHFPVLALWNNGVNYNTKPVWIVPDVVIVNPGQTVPYRLDLCVSDEETPDNLLVYGASIRPENPPTDPVDYGVQGNFLYATMTPDDPPGHAHFNVGALDGIEWSEPGIVRIVWDDAPGNPPNELDEQKTGPSAENVGSASLELSLTGSSVIRGAGRFAFTLPGAGAARLSVYDVSGRLVATIADGFHSAGRHEATWNAEGAGGKSGVYFLILRVGDQSRALRTALIQ